MIGRRSFSWARARTALVVAGLAFATASLVSACLDHYAEDFGCPEVTTADGGVIKDCDAGDAAPDVVTGSGSGSGAL